MRKFKLLRDLPSLPAGTVFKTTIDGNSIFSSLPDDSKFRRYEFTIDEADGDFFEEIFDDMDHHVDALVKLVAGHLQFDNETWAYQPGTIGLDAKRPFGFSGESVILSQILEHIGIQPTTEDEDGDPCYSVDQYDYARKLYQVHLLPAMVKKLLA